MASFRRLGKNLALLSRIRRNALCALWDALLRGSSASVSPLSSRHISQVPLNSMSGVVLQLAHIALLDAVRKTSETLSALLVGMAQLVGSLPLSWVSETGVNLG
jgi:hypothetical protein